MSFKKISFLVFGLLLSTLASAKEYKVAWSHYTGWEPWGYAQHAGILEKWARTYDIKIKLDLINDYIESINLYTAGKYDACTMTNMDALTIPAVGGIDSTALILGDFSNGNDGIVMKNGTDVASLKGREVKLVELSVSHYLLSRALEKSGMKEKDLKIINTSDADIGSIFITDKNAAAVTWNPILMKLRQEKGATVVFDSSKIPGEIMDLLVVKTGADEKLKKALVGAWYETMSLVKAGDKKALEFMAKNSGSTVDEFKAQLETTKMFFYAA
jgi:NitT/TauT family transport system substrate-binding protein